MYVYAQGVCFTLVVKVEACMRVRAVISSFILVSLLLHAK